MPPRVQPGSDREQGTSFRGSSVTTETTDIAILRPVATVFYDGQCSFCTALARRFGGLLHRAGFALQTLQVASRDRRLATALGLPPGAAFDSMRVLPPTGLPLSGADAVVYLARRIWWARPLSWLSRAPLGMAMVRAGYGWVARHRGCVGGVCGVTDATPPTRHVWTRRRPAWALLFLTLMLAPAPATADPLPPWVLMWTIAFALFFGFKVLTWSRARKVSVPPWRSLAYLFAWVGMDAEKFLSSEPPRNRPLPAEWGQAALRFVAGLGLLGFVVQVVAAESSYLAAWIGLVGLILVLHFGLFHLLALGWQVAGVAARPIMQGPLAAQSLGEFWGRRWNSGFRQLSHDLVFEPLLRSVGPAVASLTAFGVSGLIHRTGDLGAGLGWIRTAHGVLPTARFGRCCRAFATGNPAGPAAWLEGAGIRVDGGGPAGLLAVSSSVHRARRHSNVSCSGSVAVTAIRGGHGKEEA